jgi:hypothetical protein
MDFFVGGYFLVQGVQAADWMNKALLPARFWTVSDCICTIYPSAWVYSWTTKNPDTDKDYQQILRLGDEAFQSLQAWADEMLNKGELGWPNVFFKKETARQFNDQYLKHIPDIMLLSIAISEEYWAEFIEKNMPDEGMGEGGVYRKLLQKQLLDRESITRGFEILGDEWGGQFHSFVCNHLGKEYAEKLHITFNQYGLIDLYEDAVRATSYTNLDEVPAEPVLWQPWLISEYPLTS